MLLEQLKKDWFDARKARESDKALLLSTLYSECQMIGKDDGNRLTTDAEVVARVKKFIKGIDENIERLGKEEVNSSNSFALAGAITKFQTEKEWISVYLPKQMTEEELKIAISTIMVEQDITSVKAMGMVMKTLNAQYNGQFDGKMASGMIRELLS